MPAELRVHQSVISALTEKVGDSARDDDFFRADTRPNMIVVKYLPLFESADDLERHVNAITTTAQAAGGLESATPLPGARGAADGASRSRWHALLRRDKAARSSRCQLTDIGAKVVFHSSYLEIQEVDFEASGQCIVDAVDLLSRDARVLSITAQSTPRLLNYLSRGLLATCDAGDPSFNEAGLSGLGEIVGVADSGLSDSSCFFWDNSGAYSSPKTTRTSLNNLAVESQRRKVIQYVSYADGSDPVAGHGTHVVGTIVGSSLNPDYTSGDGIAPNAKVVFFDVQGGSSAYLSIPDLDSGLLRQQYLSGARVFSNSWGGFASGERRRAHTSSLF